MMSDVRWHTPIIPSFGRLRDCEFQTGLKRVEWSSDVRYSEGLG